MIADAGLNESRRDVNRKPQPRDATAPFEPATQIGRQADALPGDAVHGVPGCQDVGPVEFDQLGPVSGVGVIGHRDRLGRGRGQHAQLTSEVEVHGRG